VKERIRDSVGILYSGYLFPIVKIKKEIEIILYLRKSLRPHNVSIQRLKSLLITRVLYILAFSSLNDKNT
jgi:hypothetical protein